MTTDRYLEQAQSLADGTKGVLDISRALSAAHADGMREGMQRAAEIARCDCCAVCGESPGYPKCANEIAAAILAEAGEREGW